MLQVPEALCLITACLVLATIANGLAPSGFRTALHLISGVVATLAALGLVLR